MYVYIRQQLEKYVKSPYNEWMSDFKFPYFYEEL